jgi:phage terminase small subunit
MTRRKTAAEKRLAGRWRADRDRTPAQAPPREPAIPANLPEDAREVWRSLAPDLLEAGLLTSIDGATFGLLCRLIAHIDECYRLGELPSRDVLTHFRPLAKSFGLDPDARHKLALERPKTPDPHNIFEGF